MKKPALLNQKGFTLIEIISVLVILGILAAVAVPKYIDLQNEARIKAAQGAIAEVQARLSMSYGKYLLTNGSPGTFVQICAQSDSGLPASGTGAVDVGADFTVTLTAPAAPSNDATISVTVVKGTAVTVPDGIWTYPTP